VTAKISGKETKVDVTVQGLEQPSPVSFKNGTLAALVESGLQRGACHGSPSGKGASACRCELSTPPSTSSHCDLNTTDGAPTSSRLTKASSCAAIMELAHGGGRRLKKHDAPHDILHDWIAEGLRLDCSDRTRRGQDSDSA